MKVCHFTAYNGSGMNAVAVQSMLAERKLGIDSHVLNVAESPSWDIALDADVHIAHTHWPDFYNGKSFLRQLKKTPKIVTVFHGTPEFVFRENINLSRHANKHGIGDGVMMMQHWLKRSDARVTFWPRHQAIYQSMVDRGTEVFCVPLGVDQNFWKTGPRDGAKWGGNPSLLSCENPHIIKDPLDLVLLWPWVYPQLDNASLNLAYLAENTHRYYAPLMNMNDAAYGMHWSSFYFSPLNLRNAFRSVDFFIGLVRYGDFNHLSLQAAATGTRTISYAGNPFAQYWITEGDQREMALQLLQILRGDVQPRVTATLPDAMDTAKGMVAIYKQTLKRTVVPGFTLPFAPTKDWNDGTGQVIDTRTPKVKDSAAKSTAESKALDMRQAAGRVDELRQRERALAVDWRKPKKKSRAKKPSKRKR